MSSPSWGRAGHRWTRRAVDLLCLVLADSDIRLQWHAGRKISTAETLYGSRRFKATLRELPGHSSGRLLLLRTKPLLHPTLLSKENELVWTDAIYLPPELVP